MSTSPPPPVIQHTCSISHSRKQFLLGFPVTSCPFLGLDQENRQKELGQIRIYSADIYFFYFFLIYFFYFLFSFNFKIFNSYMRSQT